VPRTIFAMGGGGFTSEPSNPLLDEYVLTLADVPCPRICFLPTASGDPERHLAAFYAAFGDRECEPTHLSLFRLGRSPVPVRERLLGADIVYVGGGSMINMLAVWHAHGVDEVMREAWERGTALCGLSAGAMCWFQWGITTSTGAPLPASGLGLLPGSNSVHYDTEPARRPVYHRLVVDEAISPGFGVDDGVGLRFEGSELVEAVSSRTSAHAFRVQARDGAVSEEPLPVRYLGDASREQRPSPPDVLEWRQHALARRRRGAA
jgi:dipeptidase E